MANWNAFLSDLNCSKSKVISDVYYVSFKGLITIAFGGPQAANSYKVNYNK